MSGINLRDIHDINKYTDINESHILQTNMKTHFVKLHT